jgi:hypothetical protein
VTRVLAVADADSYLKWSAATLDRLPSDWDRRQLLITSPITPSAEQSVAATGGVVAELSLGALSDLIRRDPPDVLLLACTGPTVRVLTGLRGARGRGRPVLVTGLPGISVPASARAVDLRRGCDLLVVHSIRERAEFARLVRSDALGLRIALSRLPFLSGGDTADAPRSGGDSGGSDVVFAAQAKVPPSRADREAILLALAEVRPLGSAVVKVRALSGEQQTHREEHPYPDLWADLVAEGRVPSDAVRFRAGPISAALRSARCLVTVSSTAALEAMDADVPVVVLSDFGVDAAMINVVFSGSDCLGTLADVRAGRAFRPDPSWLAANYFHPAAEDDLTATLRELLVRRRAGLLLDRPRQRLLDRSRLRALVRLVLPARVGRTVAKIRSATDG